MLDVGAACHCGAQHGTWALTRQLSVQSDANANDSPRANEDRSLLELAGTLTKTSINKPLIKTGESVHETGKEERERERDRDDMNKERESDLLSVHARTHARTHSHTHTHTHTHIHIYTHTYTFIHTHTYTHKHAHMCIQCHSSDDSSITIWL